MVRIHLVYHLIISYSYVLYCLTVICLHYIGTICCACDVHWSNRLLNCISTTNTHYTPYNNQLMFTNCFLLFFTFFLYQPHQNQQIPSNQYGHHILKNSYLNNPLYGLNHINNCWSNLSDKFKKSLNPQSL
jgi:hypothetical protein